MQRPLMARCSRVERNPGSLFNHGASFYQAAKRAAMSVWATVNRWRPRTPHSVIDRVRGVEGTQIQHSESPVCAGYPHSRVPVAPLIARSRQHTVWLQPTIEVSDRSIPMDRFDAMRAFVQVLESGSYTKAAVQLNLHKATVSQQIQQLEERLGTRLLTRTTRSVTPDRGGPGVLPACVHHPAAGGRGRDDVAQRHQRPGGAPAS